MTFSRAIYFSVAGALCATARAQVTTDDCAAATVGSTGPGTIQWDNSAASMGTEGQTEALCDEFGTTGIDDDVWTIYVAGGTGSATVRVCNSTGTLGDSKIAAYPGSACPTPGSALACNDDYCGTLSQIDFPITAGQSYLLQLGSFPGAANGLGTASIDITENTGGSSTLTNQDDCGNAAIDTVTAGTYDWNNSGASTGPEGQGEMGCYGFGTTGIQSDIWALYLPNMNGTATIATCGSTGTNDDTKIAAYPLAPCASIDNTSVACNDDACALLSEISFPVSCGESYLVQLGSFPSSGDGTATMNISESGAPCGPGPIGSTPTGCNPNTANSTGLPATIRAEGLVAAAAQDVTVIAEGVPAGQFGYFFASETLGLIQNPGGSMGDICVLGNQGRYNAPSQIGMGPTFSLDVGSILVPTNPSPGQPILAGETWYWQCWYRDTGNTNNFTNVVCIVFN